MRYFLAASALLFCYFSLLEAEAYGKHKASTHLGLDWSYYKLNFVMIPISKTFALFLKAIHGKLSDEKVSGTGGLLHISKLYQPTVTWNMEADGISRDP